MGDLNGDGAITPEEGHKAITEYAKEHGIELPEGWEEEAMELFDHVDANDDGKVTMDEVKAAIWEAVDANDDGQWSLKEVLGALKALAKEFDVKLKKGWRKEVAEAFKHVDADKSGYVSAEELEAAIKKYGYPDLSELVAEEKKGKGKKGKGKARKEEKARKEARKKRNEP